MAGEKWGPKQLQCVASKLSNPTGNTEFLPAALIFVRKTLMVRLGSIAFSMDQSLKPGGMRQDTVIGDPTRTT